MALGKKRIVAHSKEKENGGLGLGLEFVQYKKEFGRKRILISSCDSPISTKKKLCSKTTQSLQLEDLPQDILVRVICGVEHEDLKQLFHVSKTIREATLIAKESHFAYNTPRKTSVFHRGMFCFDLEESDEIEAPGAPLQRRYRRSRIDQSKDDSGVSVALFN